MNYFKIKLIKLCAILSILSANLLSIGAIGLTCPNLIVDRPNDLKRFLTEPSDDWKIAYNYGKSSEDIVPYLKYADAKLIGLQITEPTGAYCRYEFSYKALTGTYSVSFYVYPPGKANPPILWSYWSCALSAGQYVCKLAKQAQEYRNAYLNGLNTLEGIAKGVNDKLTDKTASKEFIATLEKLIKLEKNLGDVVSQVGDVGITETAKRQIQQRSDLGRELLKYGNEASAKNDNFKKAVMQSAAWEAIKKGLGF